MTTRIAYLLLPALLLLPLAAAAPPPNTDVGVSGQCNDTGSIYDPFVALPVVGSTIGEAITIASGLDVVGPVITDVGSHAGGQASIDVSNGSPSTTIVGDPTGAAYALIAFLNDPKGTVAGNGCTSSGPDHLEVHATVDTTTVQVCYDGTVNVNGAPHSC